MQSSVGWMYVIIGSHFVPLECEFLLIVHHNCMNSIEIVNVLKTCMYHYLINMKVLISSDWSHCEGFHFFFKYVCIWSIVLSLIKWKRCMTSQNSMNKFYWKIMNSYRRNQQILQVNWYMFLSIDIFIGCYSPS
jgi:hypothetical protein